MNATQPYVAYDKDTGTPWAAGYDRNKIFDYAEKHNLDVLQVDRTDPEAEETPKLDTLDKLAAHWRENGSFDPTDPEYNPSEGEYPWM